MVDRDLNIRKFTEYIATEFHVADQDVGRSLRYLSFNFLTIDLLELCRDVLASNEPIEKHCAAVNGRTYLIRIAPYYAQASGVAAPIKTPLSGDYNMNGLVLTFVDTSKQIDDQKQIDEMANALRQAVQTSREKETFLSHMSHDMRTPMTAIIGLVQLSMESKDLSPELRDNLEKIYHSSNYLMSLIEEILETSRINAGKVVSISNTIKEKDLLEEIQIIIRERAREAGLAFQFTLEGCENRYVLIDTEHVERILMNLLTNAIKFTPAGGKVGLDVRVTYLPEEERVKHVYTISDTGRGISELFQKIMFRPFEQEYSDEGTRSGTGLGLYICKSLLDLLGGTISCESTVGEGTTFTVTLTYTLANSEQIRLLTNKATTYEDNLLYGKNVLVAEDNPIVAEVIIKILGSKGIHAELAMDGQEAIDLYQSQGAYHFQAILMDIRMPVKNGMVASRTIRQSGMEDSSYIPIIALTADIQEETENSCIDAGMNACLTKPIGQEKLFSLLVKVFNETLNP